jgi:hypothetical protein
MPTAISSSRHPPQHATTHPAVHMVANLVQQPRPDNTPSDPSCHSLQNLCHQQLPHKICIVQAAIRGCQLLAQHQSSGPILQPMIAPWGHPILPTGPPWREHTSLYFSLTRCCRRLTLARLQGSCGQTRQAHAHVRHRCQSPLWWATMHTIAQLAHAHQHHTLIKIWGIRQAV